MNGIKQVWGCAVVGWCIALLTVGVQAQEQADSPVGGVPGGAAPGAEKSLLAEGAAPTIDYGKALEYCQCVGRFPASVKKIEHVLRGPLDSAGIDFTDQPLSDVVSQLQDAYGIPIQVDRAALEAIGVSLDEPVNLNVHNISFQSALRLMLKNLQLTYIITDEVLMITTSDEAEKRLKVCVYDVHNIVGNDEQALNALIKTISASTASGSWSENGGNAPDIHVVKPALLVVSQSQAVHEDIRDLLTTIRNVRGKSAESSDHAEHSHGSKHAASGNDVVTRSYLLQLNPTNDVGTMRSQVRELIVSSLPDETWTGRLADGQAVTLSVFHDRIVVRQTAAVQEKVEKILADSGIATLAIANAANVGMGGGGFGGEMGRGGGGFGGGGGMGGGGGGGFFRPNLNNGVEAPASGFGSPMGRGQATPEPGSDNPFAK